MARWCYNNTTGNTMEACGLTFLFIPQVRSLFSLSLRPGPLYKGRDTHAWQEELMQSQLFFVPYWCFPQAQEKVVLGKR